MVEQARCGRWSRRSSSYTQTGWVGILRFGIPSPRLANSRLRGTASVVVAERASGCRVKGERPCRKWVMRRIGPRHPPWSAAFRRRDLDGKVRFNQKKRPASPSTDRQDDGMCVPQRCGGLLPPFHPWLLLLMCLRQTADAPPTPPH